MTTEPPVPTDEGMDWATWRTARPEPPVPAYACHECGSTAFTMADDGTHCDGCGRRYWGLVPLLTEPPVPQVRVTGIPGVSGVAATSTAAVRPPVPAVDAVAKARDWLEGGHKAPRYRLDNFEAAIRADAIARYEQGCAECGHEESAHHDGDPNEDGSGRVWQGCGICIAAAADEPAPWHPYESRALRLRRLREAFAAAEPPAAATGGAGEDAP